MWPERHTLVMPYVVAHDRGGPYQADAFAAGFTCGALDSRLAHAVHPITQPVPTGVLPQLDLIAMRHGWTISSELLDEHWTSVTFTRMVETP